LAVPLPPFVTVEFWSANASGRLLMRVDTSVVPSNLISCWPTAVTGLAL
jgi:hypothetical protein